MITKKIFKNSVSLFSMRILSSLFSLILVVFIARTMKATALGVFSIVFVYFIIFTEFPLLGLNFFISREISKNYSAAKHFFCIGNILSYISVVILSTVLIAIIFFGGYSKDVSSALFWVALSLLPSGFIAVSQTLFIAFEKIDQMSYTFVLENITRSIGAICVLKLGLGIAGVFFVFFLCRILIVIVSAIILKKNNLLPDSFHWDRQLFIMTIKHWPIFFAIYAIALISSKIDFIMLSKMGSIEDVGFYSAAYKFIDIILMGATALSLSLLPLFSRTNLDNENKETFSPFLKYFSIASVLITTFFFMNSGWIIYFFYGKDFAECAVILSLLIWNVLLVGCDQILAMLLISQNRQVADLGMLSVSFLLRIAGLYFLIPLFSSRGAAIASLGSGILLLALRLVYFRRTEFKIKFSGLIENIILSLILSALIYAFCQKAHIHSLVAWVIFIIFYFAALLGLKVISAKENTLIISNIRKLFDNRATA